MAVSAAPPKNQANCEGSARTAKLVRVVVHVCVGVLACRKPLEAVGILQRKSYPPPPPLAHDEELSLTLAVAYGIALGDGATTSRRLGEHEGRSSA